MNERLPNITDVNTFTLYLTQKCRSILLDYDVIFILCLQESQSSNLTYFGRKSQKILTIFSRFACIHAHS